MRRQSKPLIVLLVLVVSTFSFANRTLFQDVKATYVEGSITQDTMWSLVDSPFVVSNNVTVLSGATLTIEPGVEVRFGGNFSITVEGRLHANGTSAKGITFTSNKLAPEAGDWSTIRFRGTQQCSLIHCTIEYGTSGVTLENGGVSILNSSIRRNSLNGVSLIDGDFTAMNNEIANNTGSGVYIAGCDRAIIENNDFTSNGDGIVLTGYLTSEITVEQNLFSLNTHSGITLSATAYDNTSIINNTFSANSYGFYVSSDMSTNITRNYISNNTVGIFYDRGFNHEAHFNDIWNNDWGMNALGTANVSATHNYWGDKTGPNHISLNPRGKGNRVGGNGVNIDFVFFLSAPIGYSNQRPTATLWADKLRVARNQEITFIGTDSYDDGRVDEYYFNFGDGRNSGWTTLSLFNHSYSSTGTYIASLTVLDDFNVTNQNTATTTITVSNITPLIVSTTLSTETINYNQNISITARVTDGATPIENATLTMLSVKGGSFTPQLGLTNSTGYFTATFTAPNVTEITDIRIITRANATGYADGSAFKYLKVLPPLQVQITSEPWTLKSEETATVTVHVTLGSEELVADALIIISSPTGSFSPPTEVTDVNGSAAFLFTAPQTLTTLNIPILAVATKLGYAEGQSQSTIVVEPRTLVVQATAYPATIISETASTVTAHVAYNGMPIAGATVTIASSLAGSFSNTTAVTDIDGNATFVFTAPSITVREGATAIITVTANKNGYVAGEKQTTIAVMPKLLIVYVVAQPNATVSEAETNVTVHVAYLYDMSAVSDANVTISSDSGGNFSRTSGLTNNYGIVTFAFTSPQTNEPINVIISAVVTKQGYLDEQNQSTIIVSPGILTLETSPSSQTVVSGQTTVVNVYATCNSTPIANVSVTISTNYGNFSTSTGTTDSKGQCTFLYNAPITTAQLPAVLVANATKNGYINAGNQTTLTIAPETVPEGGGGIALTTILLIVIPIVIVVIVVALVKLKVLAVSFREEEQ